ncbi:hypothetical protein F5148DRAFT_400567 [Russula earlei]|uniref:Uncharacterized protein n=1 Tax=Russula earlei TaxID=71964 RepID=A0ACC0U0N1_9AGAM|nr:hypothetical protein F5148DRAFT_400567 [Russula earlei]
MDMPCRAFLAGRGMCDCLQVLVVEPGLPGLGLRYLHLLLLLLLVFDGVFGYVVVHDIAKAVHNWIAVVMRSRFRHHGDGTERRQTQMGCMEWILKMNGKREKCKCTSAPFHTVDCDSLIAESEYGNDFYSCDCRISAITASRHDAVCISGKFK